MNRDIDARRWRLVADQLLAEIWVTASADGLSRDEAGAVCVAAMARVLDHAGDGAVDDVVTVRRLATEEVRRARRLAMWRGDAGGYRQDVG